MFALVRAFTLVQIFVPNLPSLSFCSGLSIVSSRGLSCFKYQVLRYNLCYKLETPILLG